MTPGMTTNIPTITGTMAGMISVCPNAFEECASRWLIRAVAFAPVAAALLAPAAPAHSQSSETLRAENEYRECLYSKTRNRQYVKGERDSDFKLLGECRNQWVAYMDVCAKAGFDNAICVMKSRLIIHAILDLTGK